MTAMQCLLTIYYYAYVCSCTCCVANTVILTLTLVKPRNDERSYNIFSNEKKQIQVYIVVP